MVSGGYTKYKEGKSKDEYPTYLGRGGYTKYKEDNDMQDAERHVLWKGACKHRDGAQVKGDGVCSYRQAKTFEVAKEIDDLVSKIAEGKEVLGENEDVLQRVLKNKPHPARLLTGGMAATLLDKFPNKSRKGKSVSIEVERYKRKAAKDELMLLRQQFDEEKKAEDELASEDELVLLRQQLDEEKIKRKNADEELASQHIGSIVQSEKTIVVPVVNPAAGINAIGIASYTEPEQQIIMHSPEDGHNRYGPLDVSWMTKLRSWWDKHGKSSGNFEYAVPVDCFGEGVNMTELTIDKVDMNYFLADKDMDVVFVVLYVVILYKRCQAEGSTNRYGFADPSAITEDDEGVKAAGVEVQADRLMKSIVTGYTRNRLIFVPWLFSKHWMLIVLIPEINGVFWMDPYNSIMKEKAKLLILK